MPTSRLLYRELFCPESGDPCTSNPGTLNILYVLYSVSQTYDSRCFWSQVYLRGSGEISQQIPDYASLDGLRFIRYKINNAMPGVGIEISAKPLPHSSCKNILVTLRDRKTWGRFF